MALLNGFDVILGEFDAFSKWHGKLRRSPKNFTQSQSQKFHQLRINGVVLLASLEVSKYRLFRVQYNLPSKLFYLTKEPCRNHLESHKTIQS